MSDIIIVQDERAEYPTKEYFFAPDTEYPEYPFLDELSPEPNQVYELIRQGLYRTGWDAENYGTSAWNPLGRYIRPGNRVLLKPNLVLDTNLKEYGEECLYTHPSLVAAMIDYVWIALQGQGSIVVADAPLQRCDFEKLKEESGYGAMVSRYRDKGMDIRLLDLRGLTSRMVKKLQSPTVNERTETGGVCIDLGGISAHANLSNEQIEAARVTSYDPAVLKQHHSGEKHEYLIAKEILDADVIINMPKPKTHRKAGVTIALKNFVGANVRKEYLPHHRIGDESIGGDEYLGRSWVKRICAKGLDERNRLLAKHKLAQARVLNIFINLGYYLDGHLFHPKCLYSEGSWYGNDTIWRTIMDLNRIIHYADKFGLLQPTQQRKILHVADMVVTGEREGPLYPSPRHAGIIAIGENCVCFDEAVAAIMGMDVEKLPSIRNARELKPPYTLVAEGDACRIVSNNPAWDGKGAGQIDYDQSLKLTPSEGWRGHIESRQWGEYTAAGTPNVPLIDSKYK